jgi:hypothetical protein
MTVTFPAIRPGSRRLIPGTVPQSITRTVNGRTVRRPMASHQGGMVLEVEFPNRPDSEVEAIRQVRNAAGNQPVILPDELWDGDPELLVFVKFLPPDTAWRFKGDVEVEWAKRGRATIKVQFANYRRTVFTLPPPPEIEVPPPPPLVYGFAVSETTSPSVFVNGPGQAIITKAGSVYWGGSATIAGSRRSFLMKYDFQGNQLWARWIEGPYAGDFSDPVICEGPGDGVYLATRGPQLTGVNGSELGASVRVHLFATEGALAATASYQFNAADGGSYWQSIPTSILYEATQDRVWVGFENSQLVTMRALTLDQPWAVDVGASTSPVKVGLYWLEDKQRVLYVGGYRSTSPNGFFVREYAPNLQILYQSYAVADGPLYDTFAVDSFGGVYAAYRDAPSAANCNLVVIKTAASDAGYTPVWKRQFSVKPTTTAGGLAVWILAASIGFMADKRMVVMAKTPNGSAGRRDGRLHLYVLSPDQATIESKTWLNWSGEPTGVLSQMPFMDPTRQLAVFTSRTMSLGITSFKLPLAPVNLALTSTITGGSSNLNMTGNSDYTPVAVTELTPLPPRTAWTAQTRNINPMSRLADAGWSTTDLTATVQHATKATGPLQVP